MTRQSTPAFPRPAIAALLTLLAPLALWAPGAPAHAAEAPWRPPLMAAAEETAAALEACPAAVREKAGVYLLTASGYELVRPSGNGFHAFVGRSQPDAFEPECFDAEGSATLLQAVLLRARLRMEGVAPERIETELAAAWAGGRLRAPRRAGINYMLSPRNRVPIAPDQVIPYRPHVMFYAPYLTDADVGGDMDGASPVFMINAGRPDGYVIVPVPDDEN